MYLAEKLNAHYAKFTELQHSLGYSQDAYRPALEFIRYCAESHPMEVVVSKKMFDAWISQRTFKKKSTQGYYIKKIRVFLRYVQSTGEDVFIPGSDYAMRVERFSPYIYTDEELVRLFDAIDTMPSSKYSPNREYIIPVIFRMMYCCGMRLTETTSLRGEDVDLSSGIITIRNSKFGKSRYVPMSEELRAFIAKYAEIRLIGSPDDWFLPARDGGYYGNCSVYTAFRELIRKAGISHGGRGKGPRIHDFRHTFAIHCLQNWTKNGADITTALPYLREYLGHEHLSATEQYLRMTAEVYPEISALMQKKYGYVIPVEEVSFE